MNTFTFTGLELIILCLAFIIVGFVLAMFISTMAKIKKYKPNFDALRPDYESRAHHEKRARKAMNRYIPTCLHRAELGTLADKYIACTGSITGILYFRDIPSSEKHDEYGEITLGDEAKIPFTPKQSDDQINQWLYELFTKEHYSDEVYKEIEFYADSTRKSHNVHAQKILERIHSAVPSFMLGHQYAVLSTKVQYGLKQTAS